MLVHVGEQLVFDVLFAETPVGKLPMIVRAILLGMIVIQTPAPSQALIERDLTLGVGLATGARPVALSRGFQASGEVTYSLTNRLAVAASGGRFDGSLNDSEVGRSSEHHQLFWEVGANTQFRLQKSTSPFLVFGIARSWGSGTEESEDFAPDRLDFTVVSAVAGIGVRYVPDPDSHWGASAFYKVYFPIHRQQSLNVSLVVLRPNATFDRAGLTLFVRF